MAAERHARSGTATPSSTTGSTTVTETEAGPSVPIDLNQTTLRLRAEPEETTPGRRIQWAEDVVDNEGMGKKSSKVCCIYHKPREAGNSSDDSSSSSSSDDSDNEPDLSRARPARRSARPHDHNHDDAGDHCHGDDHDSHGGLNGSSTSKGKGKARKPSPNAYEKVPKKREQKT